MQYLTLENAMWALGILSVGLPIAEKIASETKNKVDDEIVHKVMDVVQFVTAYLPRVTFKGRK